MALCETLDETWPARPEAVPVARHAVRAHLAAVNTAEPPLNDICLAVSEAVTNVVNHAYPASDPGPVRVRVDVDAEEIALMVQDEGSGMVPRPDSPGLGLGLPLIATMSDRFEVHALAAGGTRLCAWFSARPAGAQLPS